MLKQAFRLVLDFLPGKPKNLLQSDHLNRLYAKLFWQRMKMRQNGEDCSVIEQSLQEVKRKLEKQ